MVATLDHQPVRAKISIGSLGSIETPDVVSFSVRRARGQMSATFQVTVKVDADELSSSTEIISSEIVIEAGLKSSLKTIFTGKIYSCIINPIRTDASKVMLNLSGKDVLCRLEGQKTNRRLKTYRDGATPPERTGYITTILRKNIPIRQEFPTNIYTADPTGLAMNPEKQIVHTELYQAVRNIVKELNREKDTKNSGDVSAEITERGGEST